MTIDIGLIVAASILFLLVSFVTALLARLLFRFSLNQMSRLAPSVRANALWALAALPLLFGLISVLLVMLPSITHAMGIASDHCMEHGHHGHLCFVHSPLWAGNVIEPVIFGLALLVVVRRLMVILTPYIRSQLALSSLRSMTGHAGMYQDHQLLSSRRVFAFTAGLLRPRIYVSSRLAQELSDDEYRAVLEHENGHRLRRDGLRRLSAQILSEAHFPQVRRALMLELGLAIEQSCDEHAAQAIGDRLTVAQAIVKLSRMARIPRIHANACQAFNASDCERRVTGLLNPPIPRRHLHSFLGFVLILALCISGAVTADFWHHSVESMLSMYTG
jgi:Zn-dependent protease with chaperone function